MLNKNQDLITITPGTENVITYEQMNTINTFQKMWLQLAMWTRDFIHSTIFETPNQIEVTERLYRIPSDFYNAFRLFYGPEVSQEFMNLFSSFIISSWGLIRGMKSGDSQLIDSSTTEWYRNADQLATFLSQINIYWDENQWRYLLYQYIQLKIQEIIAITGGNYEQEIAIYDRIEDMTSIMGHYMARGIIARSAAL